MAKLVTQDKACRAEAMSARYLADYNARLDAGKNDHIAERLLAKAEYWLDRANVARGWH